MDVSGDESKIQCRKEQYCIGIWNVRSMNEVKLDVVKQEMVRINIDILGISELKWTRMGKFNSVDHYIYYCGQESHRRNEVALIINKRVQNALVGCNLKDNRMVLFHFQGKPFNITLFQVCAPTTNAERSWSWSDLSRPRIPPRTNTKRVVLFIRGNWNAKVGSQDTTGERGKFVLGVQNEPGQRLTEFCQKRALVIANTLFQQHKKWLYTWTSPNGQYKNQIDYIVL